MTEAHDSADPAAAAPGAAAAAAPRVALVTGAGAGIGAACARRLAADGLAVAVTDIDGEAAARVAAAITASGGAATAWRLDVTDEAEVGRVVADTGARLGPVSVVVASAGVVRSRPLVDIPLAEWNQVLAINLTGTLLVFQAVARGLLERDEPGCLLAVASVSGRGGRPMEAHYAASKAGVISLVRSASQALAPRGIRVNAICPGVVDTEMTRALHAARARETGIPAEVSKAAMVERIPLRRMATADEVADVAGWLVSAGAGYVTGQAINVDGGFERD
jgi:NAD(P)-dependent dehydrogenase (short-subunit alcohol dehydrogenase family)